jgi:hypothetical protein
MTDKRASRICAELKRRGHTPSSVLRRLGLDQGFLRGASDKVHDDINDEYFHRGGEKTAWDDNEADEETLLKRMGETLESIRALRATSHPKSDPRGSSHEGETVGAAGDTDPPIEPPGAEQNLGGKDDGFEPFREHLRQNSEMSEDEIEQACELARNHLARRGSNGVDRTFGRPAKDRFPQRRHGSPIADGSARGAMDSSAKTMFPGLARIGHEPSVASSDRARPRASAKPATAASKARLHGMFPGLRQIRGSGDVAHVAAEGDHRSRGRFEV